MSIYILHICIYILLNYSELIRSVSCIGVYCPSGFDVSINIRVITPPHASESDYTSIAERERVQEVLESFSAPTVINVMDTRRGNSVVPVYIRAWRLVPQG